MLALTSQQNVIHQRALQLSRQHREVEASLVQVLRKVEETKLYKRLDKSNLFRYVVDVLEFSNSTAYGLIAVMKLARSIPALQRAIVDEQISVSRAMRIVAALKPENAAELIEFARTHTWPEIDFEVAKRNPRAAVKDKAKPISESHVQVTITVSRADYEKLKRVESLEAQRGKTGGMAAATVASWDAYLERQDPVRKAERAAKRPPTFCARRKPSRKLTAAEKHSVYARDQGRCTHLDASGKRCNSDRWVDIHHIILVSEGGTNDPENLRTLCSFHHRGIHQMVRERIRPYVVMKNCRAFRAGA